MQYYIRRSRYYHWWNEQQQSEDDELDESEVYEDDDYYYSSYGGDAVDEGTGQLDSKGHMTVEFDVPEPNETDEWDYTYKLEAQVVDASRREMQEAQALSAHAVAPSPTLSRNDTPTTRASRRELRLEQMIMRGARSRRGSRSSS